jgi:hypothetical protein
MQKTHYKQHERQHRRSLESGSTHAASADGKRTLTRKDILREYGVCSRSVRRLELRQLLVPLKLFKKKLYLRQDVEACFEGSK